MEPIRLVVEAPSGWMCLLALLGCYFVGGIPFGLMIGKLRGVDIRQHGSGNIGATNVWRVCGKTWGLTCFALDALKGYVPVALIALWVAKPGAEVLVYRTDWWTDLTPLLAVFMTVLGHIWSPYLLLSGGKGVATSAGAVAAVAGWPLLVALAVWGLVFAIWRYVSLASICAALALPIAALVINRLSTTTHYGQGVSTLLALLAIVAVYRHQSNIHRLLEGTESRMGTKRG